MRRHQLNRPKVSIQARAHFPTQTDIFSESTHSQTQAGHVTLALAHRSSGTSLLCCRKLTDGFVNPVQVSLITLNRGMSTHCRQGNPTLYQGPGISETECYFTRFFNSIGDSDSAISKYTLSDGLTIYFATACIGDERRFGELVLPAPEPNLQSLAVQFADPIVKRAVWGHGRYTRPPAARGLDSHFKTVLQKGNWQEIFD
jgi:hypothetical protein